MNTVNTALNWIEQGRVPDALIRAGIRRLCRQRLLETGNGNCEIGSVLSDAFADMMCRSPIAVSTNEANQQHYELPPAFFEHVLGPNRKYSACYWDEDTLTLEQAERLALELTCQHADIQDGQRILELGCGWGSLSLWIAQHYPRAHVTAVSNSLHQREYIMQKAKSRGLENLVVVTANMTDFDTAERFDRIVSVEMFEHMRNWPELFKRVQGWLFPTGKFLMHVFVHRHAPYLFEARDPSDWMSQYFFTGGMMPSDDLALRFQDHLRLVRRWRWNGGHYEKTANAWLDNMDEQRMAITPILEQTYGEAAAEIWRQRWRMFFMACAELFAYDQGQTWWVSHYLFERRES